MSFGGVGLGANPFAAIPGYSTVVVTPENYGEITALLARKHTVTLPAPVNTSQPKSRARVAILNLAKRVTMLKMRKRSS